MRNNIKKGSCLRMFIVIYLIISILYCMEVTTKCYEYKAEIEKRINIMDKKFIECLEEVDINEISKEEDSLSLFERYAQSAVKLKTASGLISETSYATYDDEELIGYRKYAGDWNGGDSSIGKFSSNLRLLSAYLENHAKEQEIIEPETSRKIESIIDKIIANIDSQNECKEYISQLIEFVSGELNHEE